ncbi:MAG: hypothetical protein KC478_02455 [Bacteriovoracaceae bacterium]|nr:hypothetical protein [Bacteriovoracaceae bacterium]
MAYEWINLQSLLEHEKREKLDKKRLSGIPGTDKTRKVVGLRHNLCASQYLQTASVFGYHGVYRLLANTLELSVNGILGPWGAELLDCWQREQGLNGFFSGVGPGNALRDQLKKTIDKTIRHNKVSYFKKNQPLGELFYNKLHHLEAGKKEANLIWDKLNQDNETFRSTTLNYLIGKEGSSLWKKNNSERAFLTSLRKKSISNEQALLIDAINAYEGLAKICYDSFYSILYALHNIRIITKKDALKFSEIEFGAKNVSKAYEKALEKINLLDDLHISLENFQKFQKVKTSKGMLEAILDHHDSVQSLKGEFGKAKWIKDDENRIIRNKSFSIINKPMRGTKFVHQYRINSLWQFACDLKKVR